MMQNLPISFEYLRGGDCHRQGPAIYDDKFIFPNAVIGQSKGITTELKINDKEPILIKDGWGYFVTAGSHTSAVYHNSGSVSLRWAHINCWILGSIDLFSFFEIPHLIEPDAASQIASLLGELNSPAAATVANTVRQQSIGLQICDILLKHAKAKIITDEFSNELTRLYPVIQYINTNLSENITRGELARIACLSEPRFHTVFKNVFLVAPLEYVKQLRLKKAQVLLANSKDYVESIGRSVGYHDVFNFSRQFKAYFGVSPSDYRKGILKSISLLNE
ncbi:MAG: helix-turn-helix transcriptional regulator [Fibrobacteres bacterium]|nr:helix-turn-helix transcriptional regulator [Fibrobacterota bacterium]